METETTEIITNCDLILKQFERGWWRIITITLFF